MKILENHNTNKSFQPLLTYQVTCVKSTNITINIFMTFFINFSKKINIFIKCCRIYLKFCIPPSCLKNGFQSLHIIKLSSWQNLPKNVHLFKGIVHIRFRSSVKCGAPLWKIGFKLQNFYLKSKRLLVLFILSKMAQGSLGLPVLASESVLSSP